MGLDVLFDFLILLANQETQEPFNCFFNFGKGVSNMKSRTLIFLAVALTFVSSLMAAPTVDSEKVADKPLPWQKTSKFGQMHADLGGLVNKWPGYGSFDEARRILGDALRYTDGLYSNEDKYRELMRACRDAKRYTGSE